MKRFAKIVRNVSTSQQIVFNAKLLTTFSLISGSVYVQSLIEIYTEISLRSTTTNLFGKNKNNEFLLSTGNAIDAYEFMRNFFEIKYDVIIIMFMSDKFVILLLSIIINFFRHFSPIAKFWNKKKNGLVGKNMPKDQGNEKKKFVLDFSMTIEILFALSNYKQSWLFRGESIGHTTLV